MRRFNKLLKSGTSLMLVFAMLLGMCGTALAVGDTENDGGYVALGDFVTEDALARFTGSDDILGGGAASVAYLYAELVENQDAVAAADVIALGVGNADINIYAVNNVLGVIGKDVVGIGSVDYGTLEDALANCDALTRSVAMQVYDNLYGKLESAISERVTDADLVTTLLDILVYSAVSFVANYSAILEEVATVNPDATVMIVGLVNMLDGMVIEYNGQTIELDRYFGYVVEALNAYLAAVPTAMQMNGDYENVTFLYAEAADAEVEYVKPVSVEGISEVVEELVWPVLEEELKDIPNEIVVNGVKVDVKKNIFDAICVEIEKAVCAADEPNPIVLSTDINLDGLFGDVSVDVNTDALTESAMELVMDFYEAWQRTEEGQAITEACYNFMMGKVEEMVKDEAEDGEAYVDALNEKLIAELNKEFCETHQVSEIESVEWADLWNSLIAEDYETEAEALFYEMLDSVDAKEIILAHAYEVAEADLPGSNELADAVKEAQDELYADAMAEMDAAIDEALAEEGLNRDTATPELIAELEEEYQENAYAEIYENEENVEKLTEEVMEAILSSEEFDAAVKEQVDELWSELWVTAWDEALEELYTTVNEKYNDGVKTLNDNEDNLPLALLEIADSYLPEMSDELEGWIGDMRTAFAETHVETVEGLFNGWVNDAATELVEAEINGIMGEVLAGEEIAPLMYLLGRLLVGDGMDRYITKNGTEALYAAMVEAYGDNVTVQDEVSDKVEKLIDLVLKYGPKAMDKVGAIEKLRSALDIMVEKLDGRGGSKVDKVVSEIESILDEIEAIAKGESDQTAEDLVNAYIDLDATIEELRALIHGEEIDEESAGAIRAFIDAAAHGEYEINYESYYVAIGDDSVEGYAELLAAELGLSKDYETVVSDSVAASVENLDAEIIAEADLITVGFSNNTFFKYMASQMNACLDGEEPEEMDWAAYVGEEGAEYVQKALNEIKEIFAKDMHKKVLNYGYLDELLMLAVESYAYAAADYAFNYPVLMEEIREINPDALIVSVGMSNSVADIELDLSGITGIDNFEFALGEYIEYLIAAVNGEAKAYAMLSENVAYVHAPDVDIVAEENDYDDILTFIGNIADIDNKGFAGLETSEEGNEYIKDQIYDALNITYGLMLGDVNIDGFVDIFDVVELLDIITAGTADELTDEKFTVADIDGNDEIEIFDAILLLDMITAGTDGEQ